MIGGMRFFLLLTAVGLALYPVIGSGGLLDQWLGPRMTTAALMAGGMAICFWADSQSARRLREVSRSEIAALRARLSASDPS